MQVLFEVFTSSRTRAIGLRICVGEEITEVWDMGKRVCSAREANGRLLFPKIYNKRDKWTPTFYCGHWKGSGSNDCTIFEKPRKSHDALRVRSLKTLFFT